MIPIGQPSLTPPLAPPAPPTMQNVDQQGDSQAPQGNDGGMNTLANPAAPLGAPMGDMLAMKGQSLPTVSSPSLKKLSDGANAATQQKAASGTPPQPGDWARSLVAGAQSMMGTSDAPPPSAAAGAIKHIGASLGDVGAVGTVPAGGGALTGIARTLGARGQRLSAEKQNEALHAETQARTLGLMKNIYRQDQQDRTASYKQGADFMNTLKTSRDVEEGISQDELTRRAKTDPNFIHDNIIKAVGEEQLYDANGKPLLDKAKHPQFSPLYAIASTQAKSGDSSGHKVTADDAAFLKRNGYDIPADTQLDETRWNLLFTKAHGAEDVANIIKKANDDKLSEDNMRKVRDLMQNDTSLQSYMMSVPGQPLAGLQQAANNGQAHIQTIDQQLAQLQQSKDPAAQQQAGQLQQQRQQFVEENEKIGKAVQFGFNDAAKEKFETYQLDQKKAAETERHDKAEEANKAAEIAAKKQQEITSNLQGQDYLNTLPVAQRNTVRAIGEGRQLLPGNRKEALNMLEQVHQAYPDFREEKAKGWQKTYTDFATGKKGDGINALNTALDHLERLKMHSTAGANIPFSATRDQRNLDVTLVSEELAKAVKNGVATQEEVKQIEAGLGGITTWNSNEKIAEAAELLGAKLDSYQTQYDEARPSSAVPSRKLLNDHAERALAFINGKGEGNVQPASASQQQPTGHKVGDVITQNGQQFKVTSVDGKGNVTGAE